MSIPDEGYEIPQKPPSFKCLEDKIDNTTVGENTLYKNLRETPFIHNIMSGNYK